MSKAILVVDVPDNLMFNELFVSGEIRYTINSEYKYQYFLKDIDNCSLKPIPEKYGDTDDDYMLGYNNAIEEILGEDL